jgi:hypothetical protein
MCQWDCVFPFQHSRVLVSVALYNGIAENVIEKDSVSIVANDNAIGYMKMCL